MLTFRARVRGAGGIVDALRVSHGVGGVCSGFGRLDREVGPLLDLNAMRGEAWVPDVGTRAVPEASVARAGAGGGGQELIPSVSAGRGPIWRKGCGADQIRAFRLLRWVARSA